MPDRLVWGSDWPQVNMIGRTVPNDGDLIDLLLDWALDESIRGKILVDNPTRLYRLSRTPEHARNGARINASVYR